MKLLFWLAAMGAFVWFGATVPLGNRTLFEHLRAIGQSKESQELWEGTKEKALPVVDDVRKRLAKPGDAGAPEAGAPAKAARPAQPTRPQDQLTDQDRKHLRKVLGAARDHVQVH